MTYLVNIDQNREEEVLKYLKNMDCVNLEILDFNPDFSKYNDSDKKILKSIINGLFEAKLSELGLVELQTVEDFFDEV